MQRVFRIKTWFFIDTKQAFPYCEIMTAMEISDIDEMLLKLPGERLHEVRDYIGYLPEKEEKRKIFEQRTLKAEQETPIRFESVEDAVRAVFDETQD